MALGEIVDSYVKQLRKDGQLASHVTVFDVELNDAQTKAIIHFTDGTKATMEFDYPKH